MGEGPLQKPPECVSMTGSLSTRLASFHLGAARGTAERSRHEVVVLVQHDLRSRDTLASMSGGPGIVYKQSQVVQRRGCREMMRQTWVEVGMAKLANRQSRGPASSSENLPAHHAAVVYSSGKV